MDVTETSTVTSSHILVASVDGSNARHFTEFLVHIVSSAATVVTDPNAKVLDLSRALFLQGFHTDNLTRVLLDLVDHLQKVPVSALGDDLVVGKDGHLVQTRNGILLGRKLSSNNFKFLQLKKAETLVGGIIIIE